MEANLEATNLRFRKNPEKMWTLHLRHLTKSQIDFILVRRKWRIWCFGHRALQLLQSIRQ